MGPYADPRVRRRIRMLFTDPVYWIGLLTLCAAFPIAEGLGVNTFLAMAAVVAIATVFGRILGRRARQREREEDAGSPSEP